ncbi:MAG: ATP-binding protein [Magnetococcales bacterium]|nr:ATP-binding protein [Magnetococcales bacterium]
MARSDLLLSIVRAGSQGDKGLFSKSVEALIAEERSKQHHVLAERLAGFLKPNANGGSHGPMASDPRVQGLFTEIHPQKKMTDLELPKVALEQCQELVEEQLRRDLLRSHNLEPRHRVLLLGPPGNGKTSLAEALAEALMVPVISVRYQGVIGSYLGETAAKLDQLLSHVRSRHCVLFFDEFETLGKERGDTQETGEIKRVVSSLLLQIDALPSHVVVVAATNHPELLDRAVWRRFQLRIDLPMPTKEQRKIWFDRLKSKFDGPMGYSSGKLAEMTDCFCFAELEEFSLDIQRRMILAQPAGRLKSIIGDRLRFWQSRIRAGTKE